MTNFGFLTNNSQYESFANACLEAEKSLQVSPATCAILSRRALELAVKWMYSFDDELQLPYQENLATLIHERTFRDVIDNDLFPHLRYIWKLGNVAVHTNSNISQDEAVTALYNLHQYVDWIDYCYSVEYTGGTFDESLLYAGDEPRKRPEEYQDLYDKLSSKDKKLEEIIAENEKLRKQMTKTRKRNTEEYDYQVDEIPEYQTRKLYIDVELKLAGWEFGRDVLEEYEVTGMPNQAGKGFADYVLIGDDGKPLAVVEAKRTSVDIYQGKQQAKLYADCIEKMHNQRPIIFFTNGFDTRIWDDMDYPERQVAGFYSKNDLVKLMERRKFRTPLSNLEIKDHITNRPYQKEAITEVCKTVQAKERKSLLVMATGSGKTRVSVSIVDVLVRHNWVKNVLFLADRTALVKQAKNAFNDLLPSMSLCNLLDNKDNPELARMVFSTYPTMMNAIDDGKRQDGKKLFTVGHFDLIIIDESHRSIYKKYKSIFDYFDGILLGLTATPKDEIDMNTYEIFGLESGNPTYAYELEEAVQDGYLVDYRTIESTSKFMDDGIRYDDLSEEEQELYEETFIEDDIGDYISGGALNEWLFNNQTVDQVLTDLMEKGIKVAGGDRLGKAIIFAKNAAHAKHIVERFNHLYPHYHSHFCRQIDYSVNYVESLIDDFKTKESGPHIAVSVDMLDTGIDIPEVVNLVFFKKVRSKGKFWQMIGRGTRLCEDLFGPGQDKEYFLIFDYLRNFEFFRENEKGIEGQLTTSLTQRLFELKLDIVKELQAMEYQDETYMSHRSHLVDELMADVKQLNEDNFQVRMKLKYVHKYKNPANWQALTVAHVNEIKEHIAPLVFSQDEDEMAKRFDQVMYTIELAYLTVNKVAKPIRHVIQTAERLSELATIPQIVEHKELLISLQTEDFWDNTNIFELDEVRTVIRELVQFLEREAQKMYYTNFQDTFEIIAEGEPIYGSNDLKNYRKRVSQYLKEHQDEMAIFKLRNNKPLTNQDVKQLESVLWFELGSREEYEKEFGDTPITKLVRQIVGLDKQAVNEAFSAFLSNENLNANQIKFVKLIIDYVVKNGYLEKAVLQQDPFRSLGSVSELFRDNMNEVKGILNVIDDINEKVDVIEGA